MPVVQYKCPNCGGALQFDAVTQQFACEFCSSSFNENEMNAIFSKPKTESESTRNNTSETNDFTNHVSLFSCPSCGAEVMVDDETSAASKCYYCHNPVINSGRLSGEYKPDKIIPFKHDKESAIKTFKNWCGKKWFLPNDFVSNENLENMSGVYLPFWLADCLMDGKMNGIAKNIRVWTSGEYEYTETKEYNISRAARMKFHGIPADGSKKTDDRLMEAIEPFDYSQIKDFDMSYLLGFLAEKYDIKSEEVFPRVKKRAEESYISTIRDTITKYSIFELNEVDTNVLNTSWQYMLLPVWLLTYKYHGKHYDFAMNGQTGKMVGSLPISINKLLIGAGITFAAFFSLALIGGYYL